MITSWSGCPDRHASRDPGSPPIPAPWDLGRAFPEPQGPETLLARRERKLDLGSDDPVRGAGWTLDELVDAALRADRPLAEATHLATADSTQQANAPATIPTGNIIEATPPPQIIHIFTAVHIVKL